MTSARTPTVARKVHVGKSPLKDVLSWGETNLFPQQLIETVNTSVTGKRCQRVRSQFIEGNGFMDAGLAGHVIYPRTNLRLDKALSMSAKYVSMFEAAPFLVAYNGLGQKVGFKPVPVEVIRLKQAAPGEPHTHAAICRFLDSALYPAKRKDFTVLPLYNPDPDVVLEQIAAAGGIDKYQGQLYYPFIDDIGDEIYHTPDHFSCGMDMQTEAELSVYDNSTVLNGFNSAGVFKYLGSDSQLSPETTTADGQLIPARLLDPLLDPNSIEYQLQNNVGTGNAGRVIVYRASTVEELDKMGFSPFSAPDLKDRYDSTGQRARENIACAWGVPNELANIRRAGGLAATGAELETAYVYMAAQVNPYQRFIADVFAELLSGMPGFEEPVDPKRLMPENLNYFTGPGTAKPNTIQPG